MALLVVLYCGNTAATMQALVTSTVTVRSRFPYVRRAGEVFPRERAVVEPDWLALVRLHKVQQPRRELCGHGQRQRQVSSVPAGAARNHEFERIPPAIRGLDRRKLRDARFAPCPHLELRPSHAPPSESTDSEFHSQYVGSAQRVPR